MPRSDAQRLIGRSDGVARRHAGPRPGPAPGRRCAGGAAHATAATLKRCDADLLGEERRRYAAGRAMPGRPAARVKPARRAIATQARRAWRSGVTLRGHAMDRPATHRGTLDGPAATDQAKATRSTTIAANSNAR
jgi:hypothetical protein